MNNEDAIRDRVAAKRQELDNLERRIETLRVEVRTWEEALALITAVEPHQGTVSGEVVRAHAPRRRRRRLLTEHWRRLLGVMATDAQRHQWSFDDTEALAERLGIDLNRNTLRSQMSIYSDRGWVRRVRTGVYEVTEAGAKLAGVTLRDLDSALKAENAAAPAAFPENTTPIITADEAKAETADVSTTPAASSLSSDPRGQVERQ